VKTNITPELLPLLFCQLIKAVCIAALCSVVKLGERLIATVAFCGQAAALPAGSVGGFVQPLCVVALGGETRNSKHEPIKKSNPVVYRIGAVSLISFARSSQAKPVTDWL
jgi:hypothetical protein